MTCRQDAGYGLPKFIKSEYKFCKKLGDALHYIFVPNPPWNKYSKIKQWDGILLIKSTPCRNRQTDFLVIIIDILRLVNCT